MNIILQSSYFSLPLFSIYIFLRSSHDYPVIKATFIKGMMLRINQKVVKIKNFSNKNFKIQKKSIYKEKSVLIFNFNS